MTSPITSARSPLNCRTRSIALPIDTSSTTRESREALYHLTQDRHGRTSRVSSGRYTRSLCCSVRQRAIRVQHVPCRRSCSAGGCIVAALRGRRKPTSYVASLLCSYPNRSSTRCALGRCTKKLVRHLFALGQMHKRSSG